MTDTEITALTREYAEEIKKDSLAFFSRPLPESMELLIKNDQVYYGQFLQWLTRRYALVEKSKLQEEYRKVQKQMIEGDELGIHVLFIHGKIKKDMLESLFPDLGKEVQG